MLPSARRTCKDNVCKRNQSQTYSLSGETLSPVAPIPCVKKAIFGVKKHLEPTPKVGAAAEMELSLSVDHRVIDGVLGAQLLHTIVDNLENPIGLLNI